ncbi:uncharacterized protein AMSG_04003 [Thecamonas trahens ATCC 50062]|uniref:Uncharacterized protein n=1 Tax=Thecamonas trahens ATCC 50062 TaxID=461836 RepID=A0A0L0D6R3_THETB|nr:hypothetical protein AMSG_04003 [Thecamonas trahens ATCC 50062]KNC47776.1 hypothetical protein AMSG_04003 [Thecamonas trahens ATCC 50062]|eukprot:XP_013759254.1 hypothetical protein AMSG_04003 [Thecamonas trahens ATCC 50062]
MSSFLARATAAIRARVGVAGPTTVGRDAAGNVFLEADGRRYVEFAEADNPDPTQVDPMWQMWLRGNRPAPTPDEIAAREEARATMRKRIKEVQEREAREALETIAEFGSEHAVAGMPRPAAAAATAADGAADPKMAGEAMRRVDSDAPLPPTGASGTGDDFQPGKWTPNKT